MAEERYSLKRADLNTNPNPLFYDNKAAALFVFGDDSQMNVDRIKRFQALRLLTKLKFGGPSSTSFNIHDELVALKNKGVGRE